MVIIEIVNIIAAILSIVSCWYAWQIYEITKVKGLLIIFLAIVWGMLTRILIAADVVSGEYFTFDHSKTIVTGFWVLLPIGMWQLVKTLRKYWKG